MNSATIWKYTLHVVDEQALDMPVGAKLLAVQVQHDAPQLWALVEPKAPLERRALRMHGTGHPIHPSTGRYVGTFQLHGGQLVLHVFEVGR